MADAGAKLSEEIPQRPVREAEASSDGLRRLALVDDGADRFVVALLGRLRIDKELLQTWVVHDRTSKMSRNCWLEHPEKDTRNSPYRSRAFAKEVREKLKIIRRNVCSSAKRPTRGLRSAVEKGGKFAQMM